MQQQHPCAVGVNIDGVLHHDGLAPLSVDARFDMVAGSNAFQYVEVNPDPAAPVDPFLRASERTGVPIGVMGGIFCVGADTLATYARLNATAGALGCRVFNCQVFDRDAHGVPLTLDRIGDLYVRLLDIGTRNGCLPSLEVHVDMWTERFRRVAELGDWLAQRGAPLRLTLDHSHLLFKLGDPAELALADIAPHEAHALLHPDSPASLYAGWLEHGWVVHAHARSVRMPGGGNPRMRRGTGQPGRGIQYPFVRPAPGAFHDAWSEAELDGWKRAVGHLLRWTKAHPDRAPAQISCEFIPFADYGGGARYSIFEQTGACAAWLRLAARAA
jgi:hypothetical protein